MQIHRATTTGMCFGVRDALKTIDRLGRPSEVTIHGQLVHNETVFVQLGRRGFHMNSESNRSGVPETPAVLITAHGVSDRERSRLKSAGKRLIDTTCPLVKRVHETAQSLQADGFYVLVVGRRSHVEVRGVIEDLIDYEIIEHEWDVRSYPFRRIGVVCQTTTAPTTVAAIRLALVFRNPRAEIRFHDTTCLPTRENQKAIEELLPKVDAMVIVGGKNSNNTQELVARCESAGKRTIHVQNAEGLDHEWFTGVRNLGLAAGTSTLDETLNAVEERLQEIANCNRPIQVHSLLSAKTTERRVWISQQWLDYFTANAKHRIDVPWHLGARVTPSELSAIAGSLRGWQLGETSDGRHLIRAATYYAAKVGDRLFVDAARLFIVEEQRHGNDLGRFLDLAGVPRAKIDWGDTLFQVFRYFAPSMEVWATPVVMVETHAMVYYAALRRATKSPVLRAICKQILRDEVPHIRFQCERLAILHHRRSRSLMAVTQMFHFFFFAGVTIAVWIGHRKVYRAGGMGFTQYWRMVWSRMKQAWRMMKPGRYEWG